jgi:hypothetical protein
VLWGDDETQDYMDGRDGCFRLPPFFAILREAFAQRPVWASAGSAHLLVRQGTQIMTTRQQSILIGALVVGALSTSYLSFINTICCLGVLVGGAVAAQQHVSRSSAAGMEAGEGAVLGALAGAGGSILSAVLNRALRPLNLDPQSISQSIMENMQMMQEMQGQSGMPQGFMQEQGDPGFLLVVLGIAFNLVLYSVFGAIGGAIGASLFGGDDTSEDGGVQTARADVIE